MHYNGAVMSPFARWEVLPYNCATCDTTTGSSPSAYADTGAATVTAALRACVQCSGDPLLVGK